MGERTFFALWLTGAIVAVIRWLEVLAIGVFAFDLTGSPLIVSFLLLIRTVPMSVVGFWVALLAERVGPRRLLLAMLGAMIPVSLVLGALVHLGAIEIWHLSVGVVLSGCLQAADMPVRRIMLGEVAGLSRIGAAMALDASTNHITRLLGPMLGGVLLVTIGLEGAFVTSAALYAVGICLLLTIRVGESSRTMAGTPLLRNLIEGVRLVRENRMLVGFLSVTVIYNICGFPFLSMVPVIGKDVLGMDPVAVGLLAGAEGAGAFVGSMFIAVFARTTWFLRIYLYGTMLGLTMILLFGLSSTGAAVVAGDAHRRPRGRGLRRDAERGHLLFRAAAPAGTPDGRARRVHRCQPLGLPPARIAGRVVRRLVPPSPSSRSKGWSPWHSSLGDGRSCADAWRQPRRISSAQYESPSPNAPASSS